MIGHVGMHTGRWTGRHPHVVTGVVKLHSLISHVPRSHNRHPPWLVNRLLYAPVVIIRPWHSFSRWLHKLSAIGCVLFQNQTRSIQSGEKEHADLSGRSGRGHLVLVCAERRKPRPLLQVNTTLNRQRRRHAAQVGVAKPDFFRCVGADQIWLRTRSVSVGSV